ncbi:uncharacterized protein LOC143030371 [Oratosquilla oratoria]|uniref:uncharacterized protein LOC143030371 n=1 Tax=Oratosquilla oratoria TaxID=337810 RepID=UPI003F76FEE3
MATYGDQVEMGSDHSDEVEMHEQNVEMDLIVKSKAVREFLENPDIHSLYQLKVDDLHKLAEVYEITVLDAPKGDLQRQIMTALVRKEVLGGISGNESEREEGQLSGNAESNKCDWRAQVEIEKIRAEKELKLKEMENKIRLKEIEVFGTQGGRNAGGGGDDRVSQLPEFIEGEAEDFFIQFEKLATIRKWERSDWAMLVQAKFTGKAREAFAGLSLHDSVRYHRVKEAVLKTSEMTPEVYRRKLRSMKKTDGQTYGEMARESTMRFERWCKSERVEDFEDLKQLMLLEHFTERAHPDIRYEICRSRIKNITDAAQLADELTVMRKMCTGQVSHKPVGIRNVGHAYGRNDQRVGHFDYRQDHYNHQRSQPHYAPQYQERSKPRNPPQYNPMRQQNFNGYVNRQERSHVKCYGCGESGHVQYQCRKVSKSAGLTVAWRKPQVSLDVEPKRKEKIVDSFQPFITEGTISLPGGAKKQIKILRDTGANLSLVLRETLDWTESSYTGEEARIRGVVAGTNTPLHYVEIDTGYVSGKVEVGVREELPINGVDMLLGNDLAGDKVVPEPIMIAKPLGNVKDGNVDVQGEGDVLDIGIRRKVQSECGNGEGTTVAGSKESLSGGEVNASEESADDGSIQRIYPACVVTRAMMRNKETNDEDMGLGDIFDEEKEHKPVEDESVEMKLEISPDFNVGRRELIEAQRNDPTLKECFGEANRNGVSDDSSTGFYLHDHVLMRKWRPASVPATEHWEMKMQIVVPKKYRHTLIALSHESSLAGHLGVRKTAGKLLTHFYWPSLKRDVAEFCRTCDVCQRVGKPNQVIPRAPLQPIPAFCKPFSKIIIDCVGPLPRTRRGNSYLLTIMCVATRFPEAIPLRSIHAKSIVRELVKYFSWVGLPEVIQSDRGSNFTSGMFRKILKGLHIEQKLASAYHPQSQGSLERFHQTLKNILRVYCEDLGIDWDEGVPLALFAVRDAVQESTGFSPFELVYGHDVRGPLSMMKEKWLGKSDDPHLLTYVSEFKSRLMKARELVAENLKNAQQEMKKWYDKKARVREFKPGDRVLVLLPIQGDPLKARYCGPWTVEKKVGELNYIVNTPGRQKKNQLCHVNMIKPYHGREEEKTEVPELSCGAVNAVREMDDGEEEKFSRCEEKNLGNSMVLENLGAKLNHLSSERRDDIIREIHKCGTLFSDTPRRCTVLEHDVDVGLTERAREISAFATMDGLYQYRVMPFGMRNSGNRPPITPSNYPSKLEYGCEMYSSATEA